MRRWDSRQSRVKVAALAMSAAVVMTACGDTDVTPRPASPSMSAAPASASPTAASSQTTSDRPAPSADSFGLPGQDPGMTPEVAKLLGELGKVAFGNGPQVEDPQLADAALEAALGRDESIGSQDIFISPGGAQFTWQVPDRYDEWSRRWTGIRTIDVAKPSAHTETVYGYAPSFVHPDRWPVTLDGCRTVSPDGTSLRFSWTIKRDGLTVREHRDTSCLVRSVVPEDGRYLVTMTADSKGGWHDSLTAGIDVDDIVIVALGDSSASGEGNPDDTGLDVSWVDRRCHRSRTSGQALTAQALEQRSNKSSVTFLSFACSGAKLGAGVLEPYAGQASLGAASQIPSQYWEVADLRPQVDAAREALCRVPVDQCGPEDMREVDYVFVSVGLNDLAFSDVIIACGNLDLSLTNIDYFPVPILEEVFEGPCSEDANIDSVLYNGMASLDTSQEWIHAKTIPCDLTDAEWKARLGYVPSEPPPYCFDGHQTFGELRRRLDGAGIAAKSGVFVSTYPVEPFSMSNGKTGRGCGIFSFINQDEAKYLTKVGHTFNELLHREAVRNGFYSVPGIMEAFRGHGYCAGTLTDGPVGVLVGTGSYFVGFTESLVKELGVDGTIHPNRRGHEAIRDAFLASIAAAKPDRRATHQVTAVVAGVRFDVPKAAHIEASLETALTAFEVVANSAEDDSALERVIWKRGLDFQDVQVQPGVWLRPPIPVMQAGLSRADTKLEFYVFAILKGQGRVRSRPRPPERFEPIVGPIDAGAGYTGFHLVRFEASQAPGGWASQRTGARRVRGKVDFGANAGSMTVEFCVVISPVRVGPRPTAELPACAPDKATSKIGP
jgi:hypothetical protein